MFLMIRYSIFTMIPKVAPMISAAVEPTVCQVTKQRSSACQSPIILET